jgi:zinc transporter ZupT
MGVAFFDLMPEALELGGSTYSAANVMALVALGFLLYLLLDRLLILHGHIHNHPHDMDASTLEERAEARGHVRAGSLSIHSLLDGVGIGLAFKVSPAVGAVVALAVLAHDFSDGINTVSVVVRHGGERKDALRWLVVDAIAPLVGVIITLFFTITPSHLGLLLALFSGFFLYIGASDLVPESQHVHPTFWTTAMTILGALVLFAAIRLASI